MTTDAMHRLERQPFEENFLGAPVFRVIGDGDPPTNKQVASLETEARAAGAKLVVARVPLAAVDAFRGSGFRRVETLVTFRRPLDLPAPPAPRGEIHLAEPADWDGVVEISRTAFTHDRVHLDPAIRHIADDSKAAWARNNLAGRGDANFVSGPSGQPTGFNLCLLRGETAVIDLIAVAASHRGQGIARDLVRAAIRHYTGRAQDFLVGTQDDNLNATRLYESEGFELIRREATFHLVPGFEERT